MAWISIPGITINIDQANLLEEKTDQGIVKKYTVGGAPVLILDANSKRLVFSVHNESRQYSIFVGFNNTITSDTAFEVFPGGTFTTTNYIGQVYAICESGTVTVKVGDFSKA